MTDDPLTAARAAVEAAEAQVAAAEAAHDAQQQAKRERDAAARGLLVAAVKNGAGATTALGQIGGMQAVLDRESAALAEENRLLAAMEDARARQREASSALTTLEEQGRVAREAAREAEAAQARASRDAAREVADAARAEQEAAREAEWHRARMAPTPVGMERKLDVATALSALALVRANRAAAKRRAE